MVATHYPVIMTLSRPGLAAACSLENWAYQAGPSPTPGEKREKQREAFKIPLWRDKHRSHFRTGISALGLASFPHSRDGH